MNIHTKGKKRSTPLKKGAVVKIMRGTHKNKNAKVVEVNTKKQVVYLEGIDVTRQDGQKALVAVHVSNLFMEEKK